MKSPIRRRLCVSPSRKVRRGAEESNGTPPHPLQQTGQATDSPCPPCRNAGVLWARNGCRSSPLESSPVPPRLGGQAEGRARRFRGPAPPRGGILSELTQWAREEGGRPPPGPG